MGVSFSRKTDLDFQKRGKIILRSISYYKSVEKSEGSEDYNLPLPIFISLNHSHIFTPYRSSFWCGACELENRIGVVKPAEILKAVGEGLKIETVYPAPYGAGPRVGLLS